MCGHIKDVPVWACWEDPCRRMSALVKAKPGLLLTCSEDACHPFEEVVKHLEGLAHVLPDPLRPPKDSLDPLQTLSRSSWSCCRDIGDRNQTVPGSRRPRQSQQRVVT